MANCIVVTKEDMEKLWLKKLEVSDENARKNPTAYNIVKEKLVYVEENPIDVSIYRAIAEVLAKNLDMLIEPNVGSIFYHAYKVIDPDQYGVAETFRHECSSLSADIRLLEEFRKSHLKVVD